MELTITQNSALFLASTKLAKRQSAFFRRFRLAGGRKKPDSRRTMNGETILVRRRHTDNGR